MFFFIGGDINAAKEIDMKRKLIFSAMLAAFLALGFALVGCSTDDPPGSSGGINWYGTYEDGSKSIIFNGNSISGEYTISNISIGETRIVISEDSSLTHSATWAYVFSGSAKIGIIYQSTMSTSGGHYSETDYSLILGKNKWENSGSATRSRIRNDGCDVTDMSNEYAFDGDKED
jgi:hypothetical protein